MKQVLWALLVSNAVFQGVDAWQSVQPGAREKNPAMTWAARSPVRMAGVKAGLVTGETFAIETMRHDHPKRALVLAVTMNAAGVAVVAWNDHQAHR